MADFEEMAKALQIPQSVLDNLDEVDEKINKIASDSDKMANAFKSAMKQMGDDSGNLLKKLTDIQGILGSIGNTNASGLGKVSSGMEKMATEGEKATSALAKAAEAVNKFGNSGMNIAELRNAIKEINDELRKGKGVRPITPDQQYLVDYRKQLQDELKMQETSNQEKIRKEQEADTRTYQNWLKLKDQELRETQRIEAEKQKIRAKNIQEYLIQLDELNKKQKEWAEENQAAANSGEEYAQNRRKIELMYRDMFDSIQREEEKANAKRIKEQERLVERQAKLDSRLRRSNYQDYVTSTEGSLRTAGRATNYNERAQAINNLEAAMKRLNVSDANYQRDLNRLTEAHKKLIEQQRLFSANLEQVNKRQSNLVNTSQQLARQLALLFSVSQIEGYIMKLVRVRGEFELQNTALASILGNKEQADRLFAQITDLAVQSPFTIKELTTYTKSLSAYSVEYEKLYDTTKMLADVSSGLGVDMQRLILAFGQVKAANFLRGTETRQFTEAGINMLGELAKYYSELEGRIVSVSEVQDRQFRRMISFQDVEQVFKRLTSEGGMFYNMQERQAETLAGVYSNLQDKIDLMLNEIGKANDGLLKGTIKTIGSILENYEVFINAIQIAGGVFVLYRLNLLETSTALLRYAKAQGIATAMQKQLNLVQLLHVAWNRLAVGIKASGAALKAFAASNLWLIGITALVTAIYELVTWNDEYNAQIDEINKKHSAETASLIKLSEAYDKVTKSAKESNDAQNPDSESYKSRFAQLQKLNEMLEDRGYTLPIKIEFVTPENIDEAFQGGKQILQAASDFSTEFQKALAVEMNATEGWGHIFGDNLKTDLKDLSNSYSEVGGAFKANLDILENEVIVASKGLEGAAKKYYEELRAGQKAEETNTEWAIRRLTLISNINDLIRIQNNSTESGIKHEKMLNDLLSKRTEIRENEREVEYELSKVLDKFIKDYGGLENLKKRFNDNPILIKTEIDRIFEAMELDAQTKRFAAHFAANRLQVPIELVPADTKTPEFFNDWRDTVKALDTEGIFDKQLQSMRSIADLEDAIQKKYKEINDELSVLNRANTERLDLNKQIEETESQLLNSDAQIAENARITLDNLLGQKEVIEANISESTKKLNTMKQIVEVIARAFNLLLTKSTGGGNKDPMLDRFKEVVRLIEEAKKRYDELNKEFGSKTATQMVRTQYADTAAGDLIATMTFDAQGVINGVEQALQATGKAAQEEYNKVAQNAMRPYETKLLLEPQIEKREQIEKQIEDIFSQYELSVQLQESGVPPEVIEKIFGIKIIDIDDVKKQLDKLIPILEQHGQEGEEIMKKAERHVTDYQKKELEKRMNRYAEYLKKTIDGVKAAEMNAGQEITGATQLFNEGKLTAEQYTNIIKAIVEETNNEISRINVDQFKKSSEYIAAMGDLSAYSVKELKKLSKSLEDLISKTTGDLNANDLKTYQEALDDINERISEVEKPFSDKTFGSIKELKRLQKEYNKEKENFNRILEERNRLEAELAELQQKLQELQTQKTTSDEAYGKDSNQSQAIQKNIGETQNKIQDIVKNLFGANSALNQSQSAMSGIASQMGQFGEGSNNTMMKIDAIVNAVYKTINAVVDTFKEVRDLAESFGADVENGAWSNLSIAMDSMSEMNQNVKDSWDAFKNKDYIGASINAFKAVSSVIQGINAIHDNKKEQKIKKELELIDDLQYAYEKLRKNMEEAYSIDTLGKATENSVENLEAQNEALERSIAAEKDKKKVDKERIEEWERQIEENLEAIEEIQAETFDKVTGDILSDVLSVADEFTDAWLNAFLETGDGMKGLEDNFDEMVTNMLKRQASMLITQQWIEKWKKQLEQYVNADDLELTTDEAKKWVDSIKSSIPGLNEALENYFTAMQDAGINLSGGSESEGDTLSGLQKGIQSITETTAQALEALLESIRFFVSDENTIIHNIYNWLIAPPAETPLMQELKLQTSHLASIDSLLNSVIKSSSGKGKIMRVEIV